MLQYSTYYYILNCAGKAVHYPTKSRGIVESGISISRTLTHQIAILRKVLIEKNVFPPKTTRHSYYGYTVPSLHINLEELNNI